MTKERDLNHWSELVINTFLCIAGTNHERVDQIVKWLDSYTDEMTDQFGSTDTKLREKVEEFCKPYFRPE